MSKCELLPKGCDCGSTEAAKCQSSKKPMKSREEIEEMIYHVATQAKDLNNLSDIRLTAIETLKWVLNE